MREYLGSQSTVVCTGQCMSRLAKLSARFIGEGGFSIGITDVTPSVRLMKDKSAIIKVAYDECDELISDFKGGTLTLLAGCDEDQSLEVPSHTASQLRVERVLYRTAK